MKERANELFASQDYENAISSYEEASATEDTNLRAICYGNISACYLKLNDINRTLEYCDKSLELNPSYTKIRERKISLLMEAGKVKEAKEESEKGEINAKLLKEVNDKAEAALEEEKAEMMGKLKDLGSTVLGKFGLSLDNFQVNKQDGGGYSINFKQ